MFDPRDPNNPPPVLAAFGALSPLNRPPDGAAVLCVFCEVLRLLKREDMMMAVRTEKKEG